MAAQTLAAGRLVAFPTETVYGLGADAGDADAIARLYAAKGRPSFNPLIAHVGDLAAARRLAVFDADALRLAHAFWPGPLTLVLPKRAGCPVADLATAGLDTIAAAGSRPPCRPGHSGGFRPADRGAVGEPLRPCLAYHGGARAGRSRRPHRPDRRRRTDPGRDGIDHCRLYGRADAAAAGGIGARTHRSRARAAACAAAPADDAPVAPGMLASHYAPRARLRLDATDGVPARRCWRSGRIRRRDATVTAQSLRRAATWWRPQPISSPTCATLDAAGTAGIAVMPIPHAGLGEAINDRLARAAAPRDNAPRHKEPP